MAESGSDQLVIDSRSGFCKSNSTFYSKRKPIPSINTHFLDLTTFISSRPHYGKVAFIDAATGRNLTFPQFWKAVHSVSDSLYDFGIRKGQVVLIFAPNSIFYPVISLAIVSLGAIITTANPLNTAHEISKQISDSEPVLAFTTSQLLPKLVAATTSSHQRHNLMVVLVDEILQNLNPSTPNLRIIGNLNDMMREEPRENQVKVRISLDDAATMLYSSGTTGVSKGVISTHGNFISFIQDAERRFPPSRKEINIAAVPLFHIYGLAGFAMAFVALGCTTVVLSKFDMDEMLRAVAKYKATYLPLVPPIMIGLVNRADEIRTKYDVSSLRTILCGGAPLRKDVIDGFLEKFPGVTIMQGYALTESTGGGTSTDTMEESLKYGTAGLLSPILEAKIVDPESGKPLSVNESGELWIRGPTIMKGYYKNKEATEKALSPEGWLKTGDICYFDDDGFLFVVDRLKELIKYKGYQVAPAELEAVLITHPEITDVAVIPFPDEEAGQCPMAYIVRERESSIAEETVMDFVANQVAPYKKVRRVAFVAAIPKTPSGKILRKELIKLATHSDAN